MAPQARPGWEPNLAPPSDCRQGAVLVLLYPNHDETYLVLIRRSVTVGSHRGQIFLPGGGRQGSETLLEAALREASEELGIPTQAVEVLGSFSPLYIPVSNYCVRPFVAYHASPLVFSPDPVEVQSVLEVPLRSLLEPSNCRVEIWEDSDFDGPRSVPCFKLGSWTVWGATAMLLSELVTLLEKSRDAAELDGHSSSRYSLIA